MKFSTQTSAKASSKKRCSTSKSSFHPIHYKTIGKENWYVQDLEYFKHPSFPTDSLPYQVHLEHCFKTKFHDQFLVTFHDEHGYLKALTKLLKTEVSDWFYGDLRTFVHSQTTTSLVLVYFSPDYSIFKLYLFEKYDPAGRNRIEVILDQISELSAIGKSTNQDSKPWDNSNLVLERIENKNRLEP